MSKKRLDEAKVVRLRTEVPHATTEEGLPADYQARFAPHSGEGRCLYCDQFHTFTWGLAHGAGYCTLCGWPARMYHFVKGEDGNETRVVTLLQYHPDQIILPSEREAEAAQ